MMWSADLFHQAGQDALVNAGKTGGIHQIGHRQLGETLEQTGFLLHIPCGLIQLRGVLAVQPVRDEIVAVRLMGDR